MDALSFLPTFRSRTHNLRVRAATPPHEPGWHANDPRSRHTGHVGGVAVHDGAAESTMAPKIPRRRFTNPGGMQTIRVRVSQATVAASHSTTAPQNPRRRQKFHDGVSPTRVA